MKNILVGIMIFLFSFSVQSQEIKSKNANYQIEVKGNCEMCKKRIEKAAFSVSGVKYAEWNVDNYRLHIIINEKKCTVKDVVEAIAEVGHDTEDVRAKDEQYEKLHSCCRYDRK
jgi:periplasmic mercuric ion binding protein